MIAVDDFLGSIDVSAIDLCKVFNDDKLLIKTIELDKCDAITNHIPIVNEGYIFERSLLDDVLLFLAHPFCDCLYMQGPAGCGKTSLIMQVAGRLEWGVEMITLSNKSECLDLIGHQTLRQGELVFEYGPLANAMLYGEILILNEIDLVSPGDLAILNDVLEGKPLTIVGNSGEVIYPHNNFKVVATANTKGDGDSTGFYNGARLLNQAFLDRFRFLLVDYPQYNVEKLMLKKNFNTLDDDICSKLVKFARELRRVMNNSQKAGISQLSAPFSTRVLLKIGYLMSLDCDISVKKAINTCYSLRLPDVEREYVERLCNDIFGHQESNDELIALKDAIENTQDNLVVETVKKRGRKKTSI